MKKRSTLLLTGSLLFCSMVFAMIPESPVPIDPFLGDGCATSISMHADPDRYQMQISVTDATQRLEKKQYLESETLTGILEADLSTWSEMESFRSTNEGACSISITVTVRIGVDSNFVEASGTVEGIPCEGVVEAIRRLRNQLMAGIK